MPRIGAIVVPKDKDSRIDAEYALETSTWGSPDLRSHDDPEAPRKGDILLIARGFHGDAVKNIRVKDADVYSSNAYYDRVVLAQITDDPAEDRAPHWPGELDGGDVRYPFRFPIVPLADIKDLPLPELSQPLRDALRRSHINSGDAKVVNATDRDAQILADGARRDSWKNLEQRLPFHGVDISLDTAKTPITSFQGPKNKSSGQGKQSNPKKNKATERYAVDRAVEHYKRLGWKVTEHGKPIDLHCVKKNEELVVEVKGTTGGAGTVTVTKNEVESARRRRTDLFIVHSIHLDSDPSADTDDPNDKDYFGTSGVKKIHRNWIPQDRDLAPKTFEYRVDQGSLEDPDDLH